MTNITVLRPGNTYGSLVIKAVGHKYYWGVEDCDNSYGWEEISAELYTLLGATNNQK